jgi:hypothetical protein
MDDKRLIDIEHHAYNAVEWTKYRLVYESGDSFKKKYLQKFSDRENDTDFETRYSISYIPAFAKAAVIDIQNSIFNRLTDVTRVGGSSTYQKAVKGTSGGVDNKKRSMNNFIGHQVLPELLPIGKVGVYIDMPEGQSVTLADDAQRHPYLYIYQAEAIKSWSVDANGKMQAVLLQAWVNTIDDDTQLVMGKVEEYRFIQLTAGGVRITTYDDSSNMKKEKFIKGMTELPFVVFELPHSLLKDVADYQISMLNIASADMNYGIRANFPFYVEQYNLAAANHIRSVQSANQDGTADQAKVAEDKNRDHGVLHGRQYAQGLDRPGFIHPSPEPLEVSMRKQEEMKKEIRQLVNLAVANMDPGRESAESKKIDQQGLTAGLAGIGLECERGEREIATIWAAYEQSDVATVNYPEDYDAKTDYERLTSAKELADLVKHAPSHTYQKALNKQSARIMLANRVSAEEMEKIYKEIDAAPVQFVDPDTLHTDVETALVTRDTASQIRGYQAGEAEKAKEEHAERAAAIVAAQTAASVGVKDAGARGVPELDANNKSAEEEKDDSQDREMDLDSKDGKRGEA